MTLWVLEREIFQAVVRSAGQARDAERLALLQKVTDLGDFEESKLRKIVDCLEEEQYEDGQCIIKQVQSIQIIQLTTVNTLSRALSVICSLLFERAK